MGSEISIEWLLTLQEALVNKNWDSESAVINYVNKISGTKLTSAAEINQAIRLISNQMKHDYPLRCFIDNDDKDEI